MVESANLTEWDRGRGKDVRPFYLPAEPTYTHTFSLTQSITFLLRTVSKTRAMSLPDGATDKYNAYFKAIPVGTLEQPPLGKVRLD